MQSSRAFKRSTLRGALLAAAWLFSSAALAGPPLLCHPFDTAGAASLPWGGGWNRIDTRYDTARLSADTLRLLATDTPVIARMETLRRAAIYASADGAHVRDLAMKLDTRITAAGTPQAKALAYTETTKGITHKAFKPGSDCANCMLYKGAAGEAYGPCTLFLQHSEGPRGW